MQRATTPEGKEAIEKVIALCRASPVLVWWKILPDIEEPELIQLANSPCFPAALAILQKEKRIDKGDWERTIPRTKEQVKYSVEFNERQRKIVI